MQNPYQASTAPQPETVEVPGWYSVFLGIYIPAWWIGTALIAASWVQLVPATIGWAGFGLTAAASLGSYLLPSLAGVRRSTDPELVIVSSRSLSEKNEACLNAMIRFREGARLQFDGMMFMVQPDNSLECAIATNTLRLSEDDAKRFAEEAMDIFVCLMNASVDFAEIVRGRVVRITITSSFGPGAVEHCRVVDGETEMLPAREFDHERPWIE